MRILIAVLLLSACSVSDPLHDSPRCGEECAINDSGEVVFGYDAWDVTCNTGTLACDVEEGKLTTSCQGFTPFGFEVCDALGIDEDCDGDVNDIVYRSYDNRNTCEGLGLCSLQTQACVNGQMECTVDSSFAGEEICDGFDNDCDGLLDSDDPDLVFPTGLFYRGPDNTLNVGECRAGVMRCEHGQQYIFGEVLPTEEICGNDDDDDCDGRIDEDDDDSTAEAYVLQIDMSGSMAFYIETLSVALCEWAETQQFVNSRFAVQAFGVSTIVNPFPYLTTVTDFTDANEACYILQVYLNDHSLIGGAEYGPYGIWGINNDPDYMLDWPEDMRRRVVFFSDEAPDFALPDGDDIIRVTEDCMVNRYTIGGFVRDGRSVWGTMTDPCGGWLENLESDQVAMIDALDNRFGSECGVD